MHEPSAHDPLHDEAHLLGHPLRGRVTDLGVPLDPAQPHRSESPAADGSCRLWHHALAACLLGEQEPDLAHVLVTTAIEVQADAAENLAAGRVADREDGLGALGPAV